MTPDHWESKSVGDLVTFSGGSQPPRLTFTNKPADGYIRLIQIRDYKTDKFATYIPKTLAKKFCSKEDVMIGRYGPPIFQILRGLEGAYNVALIKAIPNEDVRRDYLYYFLQQDAIFRLIDRLSRRSAGQAGVDLDALREYEFPLPPLPEQVRITEVFGAWDRALAVLEKLRAAQQQRKQVLMQQLLTGKKRFPQFKGQKWQTVRVGDVFERVVRRVTPEVEHVLSITARVGFVTQQSKFSKVIAGKTLERYILLRRGEFAYNKGNSKSYPQGCIYKLDSYDEAAVPQVYICFGAKTGDVDSEFYRYYFEAGLLNSQLIGIINSGVRNDGLLNMDPDNFFRLRIHVPPVKEQKKLALVFRVVDRQLALLDREAAALRDQKKGLMQQLLTGKLRVKV